MLENEKLVNQESSVSNQKETEGSISKKKYLKLREKLEQTKKQDNKTFMDMLRTISRNHYLINQMVDRKARIMISVNTLIISLIIGGTFVSFLNQKNSYITLILLGVFCLGSILFSILAMSPETSHGELTENDIVEKRGNPLFFGNFQRISEQDYEDSMMKMVDDRDFVYRSMIQDIYYLGQVLNKKRNQLRISLFLFIAGLAVALAATFFLQLIPIG